MNNKNNEVKGIILAGGTGSRLSPITKIISKQLLPIYDKPMIYYPLCTLMQAGIRDFLIITTPNDNYLFQNLLKDGSQWGISINYETQREPNGIAQAFSIGKKYINNSSTALILGDNLFYGEYFSKQLQKSAKEIQGATLFAYPVRNPKRYGVIEFNEKGKVLSIEEKPKYPKSKYAVTGIYFYDNSVCQRAKNLTPSKRGELEITELNNSYLQDSKLNVEILGRGMVWLDTGTPDSLHEASSYVRTIESRQGLKIGCPEEISWRMGFINDSQLEQQASKYIKSGYGTYLMNLLSKK